MILMMTKFSVPSSIERHLFLSSTSKQRGFTQGTVRGLQPQIDTNNMRYIMNLKDPLLFPNQYIFSLYRALILKHMTYQCATVLPSKYFKLLLFQNAFSILIITFFTPEVFQLGLTKG